MFKEKLKAARVKAGLSLRGLEERIGKKVSAQAIGKYERGDMHPTPQVLDVLATALGVTKEYFLIEDRIGLGRIEFRENTIRSKNEERMVEGQIIDHLSRYLEIEDVLNVTPKGWDVPRQFPFPIRDIEDAEKAAHRVRDDWGLGSDPIPNLAEFLEERGFKVILADMPTSIAGVTCFVETTTNKTIPVVVVNKNITGERQRFTLSHEVGHLLLDQMNLKLDMEKVCDRFASAFLMPERVLWETLGKARQVISIGELLSLKKVLGVSVQAITYRCRDLHIINDYACRVLYAEFAKRRWLKPPYPEPFLIQPEEPQRFKRLCLRAIAEGVIELEKAAELLVMSTSQLTDEFHGQQKDT